MDFVIHLGFGNQNPNPVRKQWTLWTLWTKWTKNHFLFCEVRSVHNVHDVQK